MIPDIDKAKILLAIAQGRSVKDAAESIGFKDRQVRNSFPKFCRNLGLRWDTEEIRANPQRYIDAASAIISSPRNFLRRDLRKKLTTFLKLGSPEELTPQYVSNLSVEILFANGLTQNAIADIQEWLQKNGLSLKRKLPDREEYLHITKRAIYILDALGFDISSATPQLKTMENDHRTK